MSCPYIISDSCNAKSESDRKWKLSRTLTFSDVWPPSCLRNAVVSNRATMKERKEHRTASRRQRCRAFASDSSRRHKWEEIDKLTSISSVLRCDYASLNRVGPSQ